MTMKTSIALALALLLGFASAATAEDEAWPSRPVRLIAASGPGGNPDVLARLLADKFSQAFGKPFVVENVPGAGGIVAANLVAKSPNDGHVLMFSDSGALAINPVLNPNLGYDPIKDFAPVTAMVRKGSGAGPTCGIMSRDNSSASPLLPRRNACASAS